MPKFCGKCGAILNPEGNCPNCDPNPSTEFLGYKDGEAVSFEIPKSQGNTVYADQSSYSIDSANIPQNQPPVKYEGNVPIPSSPPVTNVPPAPVQSPPQNVNRPPKSNRRKNKSGKSLAIKLVCVLLVVCILFVGLGVMTYQEILYIPGVSESLKLSVDNKIYGEERNNFVITSDKISNKPINDEEAAKKAAKDFTLDLGYDSIADGYVLINSSTVGGYTYYRFQERYEEYPVVGRTMTIIADSEGNSCGVSTNVVDIKKNFNLDIPDFEKQKVLDALDSFRKASVDVDVNAYTKSIYSFDHVDEPLLVYEVLAVVNNMNFRLFVDPEEGSIINAYCLDSGNTEILEGNGKNMPNNPQKFNGELHGALYEMYDPDRKISVYNADKGSSTIAIEYFDADKNSYFNRRFNPDHADTAPNDEVFVIYDENGEYYEYDKAKGVYAKDDIELSFDDITFEGYAVCNLNSDKPLTLVGSKTKTIEDELAVRLMVKTAQTYDFFNDVLGRKGYDGEEGSMFAVCNDSNNSVDKAFSAGDNDGFSMITFGHENPMEWDDVAHEYTHSVEQSISALNYQNESGAIMEAYSDIFGELVEDYCYETYQGAPLSTSNLNKTCDWQAGERNMILPYAAEYPMTYEGNFFEAKVSDEKWEESNLGLNNDFGGVHKNSTVISHMAYLMTNGDNENANLSMEELANLWYRTLFILPADSTFSAFRDCMELQAQKMFDDGELTEEQKNNVSNCFDRANIQSIFYSDNVKIAIRADENGKKYKVKINGKKFKFFTLKDYSEEIELTKGVEGEDGKFEYSDTLELKDGRYTIRVQDEDNKANFYDREIVVMTNDKNPPYNSENKRAGFYFEEIKQPEVPNDDNSGGEPAAEIPDEELPKEKP